MAGVTLAFAAAALLLTTELPQRLSAAVGGSTALAELAARSPGARIGGVALKAKTPRSALAPVDAGGPAAGGSASPAASALGTSVGPEGSVPTTGPGGFPGDIFAPAVPGALAVPGSGAPAIAPGPDFAGVPMPPTGGLPIFFPGVGGGGGGGSGTVPGGNETPGGQNPGGGAVVPPGPTPGAGPIPEPSTWLMLIAGFAVIGSAMRRSRRVRFA